ncbi:sensor histidine kinase [Glacieibacterium megasporae]|uniref:sensor histidine kinase n=1 Tax=Glacieibacterium megasporae TaxID=2835787 RepID=UPI001C1E2FBB|nr:HAMP domain-containing sensor histidine kinase [Polymorphobacter megasporae]UAJ09764.1 HAMP domain-containing histidine kinase [Polymorphobacter megasporae]
MGFSRRFDLRLALRLAVFAASILLFGWVLSLDSRPATTLVMGGVVIWSGAAVWSLARRTNLEVARFVAALGQRDLVQSFAQAGRGSGFDELGEAFDAAIRTLRTALAESAGQNRFASALVDGTPTALLAIDGDDRVEMVNKAARRLFAGVKGVRIADYAPLGAAFTEALQATSAGRQSTQLLVDGLPQRAMLAVTSVERGGAPWRIVSIQIIQHELDVAEVRLQSDLVRVLTHEIMNSMTPVTSLAASAATLMAGLDGCADTRIADARIAVETLAKRAAGIMHFVESYRAFAQAPAVTIAPFDGRAWTDQLARLFAATTLGPTVRFEVMPIVADPIVVGDIELLTQVVLNLLKNAAEAASDHGDTPRIALSLAALPDGRTKIAVSDNGPGIRAEYQQDVFLPFFTTKRAGTGVGLTFARQVVLLHGGAVGIVPTATGACVEIVF